MPSNPDPIGGGRIGLGTVQFGLDYGVSNPGGRTDAAEAEWILIHARESGVTILDTAPAYGESERLLGSFPLREAGFKVVTKTPVRESGTAQALAAGIILGLRESLAKLRIPKAYALLFHRASDLTGASAGALMASARECQALGLVEKVGVSVYNGDEIDAVMGRWNPELVQLPLNVFDQRLLRSGHMGSLRKVGAEIHIRSVFLQGLLLMDPDDLPPGLAAAREPLRIFRAFARERSLTPLQAALGFALGAGDSDTVLCGVNSLRQFGEILSAAAPLTSADFHGFAMDDERLLNPSKWNVGK